MKRALLHLCLLILPLAGAAAAETIQGPRAPLPPLPPMASSPVALFRMLLATNVEGRAQWLLANKTPDQRRAIEAGINEYAALPPAEREARLQTLQVRWHLQQLMRMKTDADRDARLATLPPADRAQLEPILRTFVILPPPLQQDLLNNQQMISLFLRSARSVTNDAALRAMSAAQREELQRQFERLNQLPAERREQILAQFGKFVELKPTEKSKVLDRLTDTERKQMEQTLTPFVILPPPQRQEAMAGFKKFAELPPADRAAFLKSAEQWQTMSEPDRERWRQIVARLQKARIMPPPMPWSARRTPAVSLVTTNY